MRRLIVGLALVLVAGCHAPVPSNSPVASASHVSSPSYSGPFEPTVIGTDDGVLLAVGGGVPESAPGSGGIVVVSEDGGRTWEATRLAGGTVTGISVIRDRIYVTTDCAGPPCVFRSDNRGATFAPAGGAVAISPTFTEPEAGAALGPRRVGVETPLLLTEDGGAAWAEEPDPCGPNRNAVSISLDRAGGLVACKGINYAGAGPVDDWALLEHRGDAWTVSYMPPQLEGSFDPNNEPGLAASTVDRVTARGDLVLLSTGVGYFRSTDGGGPWRPVNLGPGVLQGQMPASEAITGDGAGWALVAIPFYGWQVLRSDDGGLTWRTIIEAPEGTLPSNS